MRHATCFWGLSLVIQLDRESNRFRFLGYARNGTKEMLWMVVERCSGWQSV